MPNDLAVSLKQTLIALIAPLRESATNPDLLRDWLAPLGYTPPTTDDPALPQIATKAESIGASLEAIADGSLVSWDSISNLLQIGRQLQDLLADLRQFAATADPSKAAATLPDEIMSLLLATWLRREHPVLFRIGAGLGVIDARETGATDPAVVVNDVVARYSRSRDAFRFDTVGSLLTNPGNTLEQLYFPNGLAAAPDVRAAEGLFGALSLLADALGLAWRIERRPVVPPAEPTDDEPEVDPDDNVLAGDTDMSNPDEAPDSPPPDPSYFATTFPTFSIVLGHSDSGSIALELHASSAEHPGGLAGYLLTPVGTFQFSKTSGQWTLTASAHGAVPSVAITTHGVALVDATQAVAGGQALVRLERTTSTPGTPAFVIGDSTGTRLELGSFALEAGLVFDTARRALTLSFGAANSALVIAASDGDGFLSSVLPSNGFRAPFDLGLTWTSDKGLSLRGSAGMTLNLPTHLSLGPVTFTSLALGLRAQSTSGVVADLSGNISASLGPVQASIEGLGISSTITFGQSGGNLGPADVAFGLKAPTGVSLSINASGVVTGGGFLNHDPATGTYAGAMKLSLQDKLTLSAYGLIATRLPDGRPGYSLLVFITADGFQPVPLGLGFMLTSIGGLIGVNRTFDYDVLEAGLKSDTLATLLFPRDPVGNASTLMQALAAAFPAKSGSFLLGLLARITWFTPTLITLDLGLVLEVGSTTRLLVLGRASALLPTADNDLVRLVLDAVGELELDAGALSIDAVLVDSRLLHRFPITGSAAIRAHWGNQAGATDQSFVLAAGGFNPRFATPAGFPTLERLSISLTKGKNPRLVCESYFAITSNTLQFGARASLYAEAIGFNLTGDIGYDVLVSWEPLHFLAEFQGKVQLKRGSHNLFKLELKGTLEGPQPLRLSGKVTFEIFWISFTVRIDATLADGAASAGLAAVNVADLLGSAIGAVSNWRTQLTPGVAHGVALRSVTSNTGPVLDPLGQMVLEQQVVPLNLTRDVDIYGGAPVAGPRRFALTGKLNETSATSVQGAFAPARFFALSDDEKLAAPSFEAMDAGLLLGDASVLYAAEAVEAAPLEYEPITLNPDALPSAPAADTNYQLPVASLAAQVGTGAAAKAPVRQVGRARFRNSAIEPAATVAPPQWTIIRTSDGIPAPVDSNIHTWSEQRAALNLLNRGGSAWTMVPTHELAAA
jgi:hypothetical protein